MSDKYYYIARRLWINAHDELSTRSVAQALRDAAAAERERCAELAKDLVNAGLNEYSLITGDDIAAKIRETAE